MNFRYYHEEKIRGNGAWYNCWKPTISNSCDKNTDLGLVFWILCLLGYQSLNEEFLSKVLLYELYAYICGTNYNYSEVFFINLLFVVIYIEVNIEHLIKEHYMNILFC